MKPLDRLAPLHLLKLWRSEGLTPTEVRARSDAWIAEHIQYLKPQSANGFRVLATPSKRGARPKSAEPDPALTLKTCQRCKKVFTVREGFRSTKSKICDFCNAEDRLQKKRGPKPRIQAKIEAIGIEVLRQKCKELGVSKVDKLYHFHSGTMRSLFPDLPLPSKLPDDTALIELTGNHTLREIAEMHGCTVERIRQRLKPLGIRALSPTEARIKKAGGLDALYQEALTDGVYQAARKYHISDDYLRERIPKIPRKPFPDEQRKIPPPAKLAELYRNYTAKDIAEMVGSTPGSVFQAIYRAGIRKHQPGDTEQELLAFIQELGKPGVMPSRREFRGHGKKTLLNRIGYLGGLQKMAVRLGLSM